MENEHVPTTAQGDLSSVLDWDLERLRREYAALLNTLRDARGVHSDLLSKLRYQQQDYAALLNTEYQHLALIEELRHHGQDIQQVATWLHEHAPGRFDARLSMGQLITGILGDWLTLRNERTEMQGVLGRSIFARLAYVLTGICRSKRRMEP